jgi:hypothetical protein
VSRRWYFPLHTRLALDVIEIEMTLPSGQAGIRHYGQRVVVRIAPDLTVTVLEALYRHRVIVAGAWNHTNVVWDNLPEVKDRELCVTALEMIDARVDATLKLFARGWFNAEWLQPLARWEVGA